MGGGFLLLGIFRSLKEFSALWKKRLFSTYSGCVKTLF